MRGVWPQPLQPVWMGVPHHPDPDPVHVVPTCRAELDDLAPLGHGVVPVRLLGGRLHSHRVVGARAQEPMASHRHGQGDGPRHQLGGDVLEA